MNRLPKSPIFYCDTNIFRGVAEGRIPYATWKQFVLTTNRRVHYTLINLIELGRHVHPDERDDFHKFKRAFEILVEGSDDGKWGLRDPDVDLANAFSVAAPSSITTAKMREIAKMIAEAPSLDDLVVPNERNLQDLKKRGRITMQLGWPGIKKFGADYLRQWHRNRLDRNNQDFFMWVDEIIPDFRERKARGKQTYVADKKERERHLRELTVERVGEEVIKAMAFRVGTIPPADTSPIIEKFSALIHAYTELLRQIVTGYNFVAAENDFFDFAFLLYLAKTQRVFVTEERKIREKIKGSSQENRVVSLQEALAMLN